MNEVIPSQPARLQGSPCFDFGEEGNKLIEITNDPMRFKATREAVMPTAQSFGAGTSCWLTSMTGMFRSVLICARVYNMTQLADEVERAINDAYGDDNKLQVRSDVDDKML